MACVLTAPPLALPVTLAELKTYLRIDHSDEDDLLLALARAATASVEAMAGVRLIEQGWSVLADDWPSSRTLRLPLSPIVAVDEVLTHSDAASATVDPSHYLVDGSSRPARIVLRPDRVWARPERLVNGIEIRIRAGYGLAGSDVPDELVQAVKALVAHWYEHREAASEQSVRTVPVSVDALLSGHREARL